MTSFFVRHVCADKRKVAQYPANCMTYGQIGRRLLRFNAMFGNFFKTTEIDRFADWIVNEVRNSLPPAHDPSAKNIAQRAEKLDKQIEAQTRGFLQSTKMNIYKKARLTARVREGMSAHGYPEPFVKSFSFDLLRRLQSASKNSSG